MASSIYTPLKTTSVSIQQDAETELIDGLAAAITQAGLQADRTDVANFYVALKHRPLAILAGPSETGKAALVECLANFLTGSNNLQRQVVPGHAWYAGGSPSNTFLVGMHARMITEKLLSVIEEASQPENAQQVFIMGLTHISPAELLSFFTEIAYQIQHKQLVRIGDVHLAEPVLFPPNLLLIGTFDTKGFDWWEQDLLNGATVIEWPAETVALQAVAPRDSQNLGFEFMRSNLRDSRMAYKKLLSLVAGIKQPLQIVMLLRSVFRTHGLELPPDLLNEVILYLANAWSAQGNGLFDPVTSRNLGIAFDLALAQLILPHSLEAIRSSESLQAQLYPILDGQLPRSSAFLRRQCEGHSSRNHRREFENQS